MAGEVGRCQSEFGRSDDDEGVTHSQVLPDPADTIDKIHVPSPGAGYQGRHPHYRVSRWTDCSSA